MLKFIVLAIAFLSFANPAFAQQKLLAAESEIAFISKQLGVPVSGKFKKFDAQLAFDPKKPAASTINFSVDLLSADIGNAETEVELKKPGWFNSLKIPNATFVSTSAKAISANKFEFAGKLTIKGISQNIAVPVTITQTAGKSRATGTFTTKRLDFKIGDGDWNDVSLVANEVVVNLNLMLTGVAPL